jgi:hypothetical protein
MVARPQYRRLERNLVRPAARHPTFLLLLPGAAQPLGDVGVRVRADPSTLCLVRVRSRESYFPPASLFRKLPEASEDRLHCHSMVLSKTRGMYCPR